MYMQRAVFSEKYPRTPTVPFRHKIFSEPAGMHDDAPYSMFAGSLFNSNYGKYRSFQ